MLQPLWGLKLLSLLLKLHPQPTRSLRAASSAVLLIAVAAARALLAKPDHAADLEALVADLAAAETLVSA